MLCVETPTRARPSRPYGISVVRIIIACFYWYFFSIYRLEWPTFSLHSSTSPFNKAVISGSGRVCRLPRKVWPIVFSCSMVAAKLINIIYLWNDWKKNLYASLGTETTQTHPSLKNDPVRKRKIKSNPTCCTYRPSFSNENMRHLKYPPNSIKWIDPSCMKFWSISYNKALFHKSHDSQTFQQLRAKSYFGPRPLRALSLAVLWSLCPSERQRISRLMQLDPR